MQYKIRIIAPGGGYYEDTCQSDSPVCDDIGMTDEDHAAIQRGEEITKRIAPDPSQADFGKQLFESMCSIVRAQSATLNAALDNDERLEAGKI